MSTKKTREGILYVTIEKPTEKHKEEYYKKTGVFVTSLSADNKGVMHMSIATIVRTFDEEKYPVGSRWEIGEAEPIKANLFGEPIQIITENNIYAEH
jgi:hypothetical protein